MSDRAVAKLAKPQLRGALIKQIKYNIVFAFVGATAAAGCWYDENCLIWDKSNLRNKTSLWSNAFIDDALEIVFTFQVI